MAKAVLRPQPRPLSPRSATDLSRVSSSRISNWVRDRRFERIFRGERDYYREIFARHGVMKLVRGGLGRRVEEGEGGGGVLISCMAVAV